MPKYKLNQPGQQIQSILDKARKLPDVSSIDSGKYVKVDSYGNFSAETGGSSGSSIGMQTFTIDTSSWNSLDPSVSGYNYYTDLNLSEVLTYNTNVRIYNVNADVAFYTNEIILGEIGRYASPNFIKLYAKSSPVTSITVGVETYVVQEITPPTPSILAPIITLSGTDLYIESGLGNYSETYDIYVNGSSVLPSVSVPNQSTPVSLSSYLSDGDSIYATAYYNGETSGNSNVVQYSEGGTLNPPTISLSGSTLTISPASGTPAGAMFDIGYKTNYESSYYETFIYQTSSQSIDLSGYPMFQSGISYYISARTYYQGSYSDWNSQPELYEIPVFTGIKYAKKYAVDPSTKQVQLVDGNTYQYIAPKAIYSTNNQEYLIENNQFTVGSMTYTIYEDKEYLYCPDTPADFAVLDGNNQFEINLIVYTFIQPEQATPYIEYTDPNTGETEIINMTHDEQTHQSYFIINNKQYHMDSGIVMDMRGIPYIIDNSSEPCTVNIDGNTYTLIIHGQFRDGNSQLYPIYKMGEVYSISIGSYPNNTDYQIKYDNTNGSSSISCLIEVQYDAQYRDITFESLTWAELENLSPSPVAITQIYGDQYKLEITSANLPTISGEQISDCYYELYIPNTVNIITHMNFNGCEVQELNFLGYIKTIEDEAFNNSSVLAAYNNYRTFENRDQIYPTKVNLGITFAKKYDFYDNDVNWVADVMGDTFTYVLSQDQEVGIDVNGTFYSIADYFTVNGIHYLIEYTKEASQYGAEYGNQPYCVREFNPIVMNDTDGMNFLSWSTLEANGAVTITSDEMDPSQSYLTINNSYLPISFNGDDPSNYYYKLTIPDTVTTTIQDNFSGCYVQELYFVFGMLMVDPSAFTGNNSKVLLAIMGYNGMNESVIYPGLTWSPIEFQVTDPSVSEGDWDLMIYPVVNVLDINMMGQSAMCTVYNVSTTYKWKATLNSPEPGYVSQLSGTFDPTSYSGPIQLNFLEE